MTLPPEAELLRIYVSENDKYDGRSLYEAIVEFARKDGLAGATVLRGALGFGAHHKIHTSKILRLSEDLPLVIEIVDTPENIKDFLGAHNGMIKDALITIEKVRVMDYRRDLSNEENPG